MWKAYDKARGKVRSVFRMYRLPGLQRIVEHRSHGQRALTSGVPDVGGAGSNRNPLDRVPGNLSLSTIVEPGGTRIGVAGEIGDIFEWDALCEQVGNCRHAARVRNQVRGKSRVL